MLAEQPSGAVVLVERDARALDAFVLHLLVDEGKRRRLLIVLGEVDDGRRQRRGIARLGGFRLGEDRRAEGSSETAAGQDGTAKFAQQGKGKCRHEHLQDTL